MLMAILSGVRGQVLHLLDVQNMTIEADYVSFRISEPTKTSRPGRHMQELKFMAYPHMRSLCVVFYLKMYLKRTLNVRWTVKKLFLTYGRVGRAASRDTIRRWIRDVMEAAGIDLNIFNPHSTRSASTSAARSGVSLRTILRTAGWFSASSYQRHYKKRIAKPCGFQATLMNRFNKK